MVYSRGSPDILVMSREVAGMSTRNCRASRPASWPGAVIAFLHSCTEAGNQRNYAMLWA